MAGDYGLDHGPDYSHFSGGVVGTVAAVISIEAAAVAVFTPVVVLQPVRLAPTVQAGFMLPVDEREFLQKKKKKIKPVIGKVVAVIRLDARAVARHGVGGVAAATIFIDAAAEAEFFDAVGHDNAFLLMAA